MDSTSPSKTPDRRFTYPVIVLLGISLFAFFGWVLLPGGLQPPHGDAAAYVEPDPTEIEAVKGEMTPPVDLAVVMVPSDETLARGRELYATYCVTCHGESGAGDGVAGKALNPPPRSFVSAEGWTRGHRVSEIFRTLSEGIQGTGMVAYDYLASTDRFALADVVRSFGEFDHGEDDEMSIAALDEEYRLSSGVEEPSRAPLSAVVENMLNTHQLPPGIPLPGQGTDTEGARLCRLLVQEPRRAALTLELDEGWREDRATLARIVVSGAPANGFSAAAAGLNPEEWELFRAELVDIVPGGDEEQIDG